MLKWSKRILIVTLVLGGVGAIVFGTGFPSYVRSSGRAISTAVKDSIPIEFEIQRARDLLEDLIPEMQANLKIVAREDVEVEELEAEIREERERISDQKERLRKLNAALKTENVSYEFGGRQYERQEVVHELARSLEDVQTAEMLLRGKNELLKNRQRSLDAAVQKLEKTRLRRLELSSQIEALEGQFRLVQAQSSGSEFSLDDTKLAQTERVIRELKKRLAVAQKVLAKEARFVESIPLDDTMDEQDVVGRVDSFLSNTGAALTNSSAGEEAF